MARAVLELEYGDAGGELRFEVEDYYLHLKLTDNKMLIESSDTDSFELPLSPSEFNRVRSAMDRVSKEIKEANDIVQIAKQLLSLVEEVFDMKQSELEKLIRDGAEEFTESVSAERIVEKVRRDFRSCLAWYRIGKREDIVDKYIQKVGELIFKSYNEIKEDKELYKKIVDQVEDGLWSRLLG